MVSPKLEINSFKRKYANKQDQCLQFTANKNLSRVKIRGWTNNEAFNLKVKELFS